MVDLEREAHAVIAGLDPSPRPLAPDVKQELRRRAFNEGDALALDMLRRDFALAREILVEEMTEVPGKPTWAGAVTRGADALGQIKNLRVVSIPPVGTLHAVAHKACLVDRETFGDGLDLPYRRYFDNYASDAQGRPKPRAPGGWGPISHGWRFLLWEILLLVDAGADRVQAERLWNHGKLVLWLSHTPVNDWDARVVMAPPRHVPTSELPFTEMLFALGGRKVDVENRGVGLSSVDQWHFELACEGLENLPVALCLMGIRERESS